MHCSVSLPHLHSYLPTKSLLEEQPCPRAGVDPTITVDREEGISTQEAIRKAALLSVPPIMIAAMAALLGGMPLMLDHGTGAEIRRPWATPWRVA
ncbi:efflux RND transporter permease subunit [Microvirga terrae]|uniref:efflux RND transporter permease subunit n=1 Tax=Microvirga terrae TaxID=2740529 RepID=UPI003D81301E